MRKYFGAMGIFLLTKEFTKKTNIKKQIKSKSTTKTGLKQSANFDLNKKLLKYNKYASVIQGLNGIIQYYFVIKQKNSNDKNNQPFITLLYKTRKKDNKIGSFLVGNLMVIFSLLTALSHISFISFRKSTYTDDYIKNQVNTQRWLEYTVTSSIMMFSFMGVSGIDSLEELIPFTFLVGITNIIGLLIEQSKELDKNNKRKLLYYSGVLTNGLPWIYINYKNRKLFNLTEEEVKEMILSNNPDILNIDDFVNTFYNVLIPAIKILTYFLQGLYYLFALNMDQKYIKPMKNKNKLDSNEFYDLEKNYIFLSMFAKSLLSWTIWSATLRPNRND